MKQVIRINEVEEPKKELKPIEFTHYLSGNSGWWVSELELDDKYIDKILYIGNCRYDGDMFAVYSIKGSIGIYKGRLNDGVY